MLGKILFTLAVVVVVALLWRTRSQHRPPIVVEPRLVNPPRRHWPIRGLALAVVGVMLAASVYLLYEHWRDGSEVIFIRVVDAGTGRSAEYQAQRGDIGDREFTTTDGRRVVLAETERLETSTIRTSRAVDRN